VWPFEWLDVEMTDGYFVGVFLVFIGVHSHVFM